ncbi:MAG: nucleotidyltransferase domain-containing protein [Nocardioidaceae bacterium]
MEFSDPGSPTALPAAASAALREILDREDRDTVGVVLSGSAARGMATQRSDVDVYVVREKGTTAGAEVLRSAAVDEVPVTLSELELPAAFGTDGWWFRWSFAWAKVLRDDTGGKVAAAVDRQATLTPEEQDAVLAVVDRECRRFDESRGRHAWGHTIDAWGAELGILRGAGAAGGS